MTDNEKEKLVKVDKDGAKEIPVEAAIDFEKQMRDRNFRDRLFELDNPVRSMGLGGGPMSPHFMHNQPRLTLRQIFELPQEEWTPDELDSKFMSMPIDKQLLVLFVMLKNTR
jgi:hypothetical protein